MTREEILIKAAAQLKRTADALYEAHTVNGKWFIADASDAQAKVDYHELQQLAGGLLAMATPS